MIFSLFCLPLLWKRCLFLATAPICRHEDVFCYCFCRVYHIGRILDYLVCLTSLQIVDHSHVHLTKINLHKRVNEHSLGSCQKGEHFGRRMLNLAPICNKITQIGAKRRVSKHSRNRNGLRAFHNIFVFVLLLFSCFAVLFWAFLYIYLLILHPSRNDLRSKILVSTVLR